MSGTEETMTRTIREQLLRGDKAVCCWGLGYIGFSALIYYWHKGVRCYGYDLNQEVVDKVSRGESPAPGLEAWLKVNGLAAIPSDTVTSKIEDLYKVRDQIAVFKIAVPTEVEGKATTKYLEQTCKAIAQMVEGCPDFVLVDVESTVPPSSIDNVVIPIFKSNPKVLVSASPRRDWFVSSEKDLARIPRIVGGSTPMAGKWAADVASIVCEHVHQASDHRVAAATKSMENALRGLAINAVNELARSSPNLDVREVCKLMASKWNIGLYEPSIGVGGYCIPLGPAYVMDGNEAGNVLFHESFQQTVKHIDWVAEQIAAMKPNKVAILGLAYRGDVPVFKMSPPVMIAQRLTAKGVQVSGSDPFITESTRQFYFAESGDKVKIGSYPEILEGADVLIVGAGHGSYRLISPMELVSKLKGCKLVLDNEGVFSHIPASVWVEAGIRYARPGQRGWLGTE